MKIVINNCYGGFSLSPLAIKAICERKGVPCYFYMESEGLRGPKRRISDEEAFSCNRLFGPSAYQVPSADQIPNQDLWAQMTLEERKASNAAYKAILVPGGRDTPRDDPDLIAVVEALGDKANGQCAQLKIVEIPDGIEWEIEEYDGTEWVAEKHKTWS